jgi:hypothetical protein
MIVFGLSTHPESNTHSKINAHILGFAKIPPLFSVMKDLTKKLLAKKKSLGIFASQITDEEM